MSDPRPGPEVLEAVSPGLLKRCRRELSEREHLGSVQEEQGRIVVQWDDGRCVFESGRWAQGSCTCPAEGWCRHRVRSLLLLCEGAPEAAVARPANERAVLTAQTTETRPIAFRDEVHDTLHAFASTGIQAVAPSAVSRLDAAAARLRGDGYSEAADRLSELLAWREEVLVRRGRLRPADGALLLGASLLALGRGRRATLTEAPRAASGWFLGLGSEVVSSTGGPRVRAYCWSLDTSSWCFLEQRCGWDDDVHAIARDTTQQRLALAAAGSRRFALAGVERAPGGLLTLATREVTVAEASPFSDLPAAATVADFTALDSGPERFVVLRVERCGQARFDPVRQCLEVPLFDPHGHERVALLAHHAATRASMGEVLRAVRDGHVRWATGHRVSEHGSARVRLAALGVEEAGRVRVLQPWLDDGAPGTWDAPPPLAADPATTFVQRLAEFLGRRLLVGAAQGKALEPQRERLAERARCLGLDRTAALLAEPGMPGFEALCAWVSLRQG